MQGPVVQPFSYDEAHPYAAGQHRGIDIGADATGETVVAPAAGTVSFAGTVPTSGKTVTIETADGYSVTLTHLGSIAVAEGATVAEQQAVGTVGPSGTPEVDGPYVHLGIRVTADPNGYLDPLGLLPADRGERSERRPARPASQPSAGVRGRTREQARAPGAGRPPKSPRRGTRPSDRAPTPARSRRPGPRPTAASRAQKAAHARSRRTRSQHRSVVRDRVSEPTASSFRRPFAEPTAPGRSVSAPATSHGPASPSRRRDASRPARSLDSSATGPPRCSRSGRCSPHDGGARARAQLRTPRSSGCRRRQAAA